MDTVFDVPVELTLKIGGKKVITMQNNRTISYLASLCHERLDTVECNSRLTTSHISPSKNVSFSSAIVAYFFANMIIRFLDSRKNIVAKRLYFWVILCKSVIFVPAKYLCGFAKNRMKNIFLVDRYG